MEYIDITYLSMDDVEKVGLSYARCIEIVESTFIDQAAGKILLPATQELNVSPSSFIHCLSAKVPSAEGIGAKILSYKPGNKDKGMPDSAAMVVLYNPETLLLECIMEAFWLTNLRTACMAAVVAKNCTSKDSERVAFIGVGGLARWTLPALEIVFPRLQEARGFARRQISKDNFYNDMQGKVKSNIIKAGSAEEALEGAEIIVTTTTGTTGPFLEETWWPEGSTAINLDVFNSWKDTAFAAADVIVFTNKTFLQRFKNIYPRISLPEEKIEIGELESGKKTARNSAQDRIMAVIDGVGSLDVAIGREIFLQAKQKGIGKKLKFMQTKTPRPPL